MLSLEGPETRTARVHGHVLRSGRAAWLLPLLLLWAAPSAGAPDVATLLEHVDRGDVSGAVQRYTRLYEPGEPEGLRALHELALRVLRAGLQDAGPYERNVLAGVLAAHGEPGALEVLERGLASSDHLVRQGAAEALGGLNSPAALSRLRRLFERGGDGRRLALRALAGAPRSAVLDLFLRALRSSDPSLRVMALRGLGRLRAPEAREPLRALWSDESRPLVAGYAAYCLAVLGDRPALAELKDRLRDPSPGTRDQAAALLGFVEDPSVAPLLREALYDPSAFVRSSASASLTRFHDRSGLPVADRLLQDSELSVRLATAASLGRMDYAVGRPLVLKALRSDDPNVRVQALDAIGKSRDAGAAGLVGEAVRHERDEFVRSEGLLVLGEIGGEPAADHLLRVLPDPRPTLRHAAAESLVLLTERLLAGRRGGDGSDP